MLLANKIVHRDFGVVFNKPWMETKLHQYRHPPTIKRTALASYTNIMAYANSLFPDFQGSWDVPTSV